VNSGWGGGSRGASMGLSAPTQKTSRAATEGSLKFRTLGGIVGGKERRERNLLRFSNA